MPMLAVGCIVLELLADQVRLRGCQQREYLGLRIL